MEISSVVSLVEESLALERAGDVAAALRKANAALREARQRDAPEVTAQALLALAHIRFQLGQYQVAGELATEALALAPLDSPYRAEALLRLGVCAAANFSLDEAETLLLQAADLSREVGCVQIRFRALHSLAAGIYIARGQFDLALAAETEALRIVCEEGLHEWVHFPLIVIAWTYITTQQPHLAREALEKLGQVVLKDSAGQGFHVYLEAELALSTGDIETARALYARARSIAETVGDPWLNISLRLGLSRLARLSGNVPAAYSWAEDALNLAVRTRHLREQGMALIERGRTHWLSGNLDAAQSDLRAAIHLLTPLGTAFELARAWLLLAALLAAGRAPVPELRAAWLEAVSRIVSGGYAFMLEQERALAFPLLASFLNSDDPYGVAVSRTLLDHLARVPPPPLHIRTLGRFEVRQGRFSADMRALRQRRAAELLALLLTAPGRTLSSEQIAEALCPERPPDAARNFFHHATSALRRALEPDLPEKFPSRYLEVDEGRVTLHLPPDSWVDVDAFEACYRRGEWEEALALYGGEFLPEYRYTEWTIAPRERLTLLYQRALLEAARARLTAGQFAGALEACWRLLALEPWHEEAVMLGMRACVALNDLPGARRLYLALEKALREDLGTVPQEELRAFYRSLTPPPS
ncbi:MAG: hypothetical protein H5T61_09170 [Thermoflexales bacterium]|nr:hypothetical protein [Thermoflexales bacterium]